MPRPHLMGPADSQSEAEKGACDFGSYLEGWKLVNLKIYPPPPANCTETNLTTWKESSRCSNEKPKKKSTCNSSCFFLYPLHCTKPLYNSTRMSIQQSDLWRSSGCCVRTIALLEVATNTSETSVNFCYTAQQPRRPSSSCSPPWQLEISPRRNN
jgi:hypothetical protein